MNMRSYSCCSPSPTTTEPFVELASLLKLMSSESRLRLLCILQDGGEHCVCELAEHVPDMSQSLISHHLADLKKAGMATSHKRGLRVYYRLSEKGLRVVPAILALRDRTPIPSSSFVSKPVKACCSQSLINNVNSSQVKEAKV